MGASGAIVGTSSAIRVGTKASLLEVGTEGSFDVLSQARRVSARTMHPAFSAALFLIQTSIILSLSAAPRCPERWLSA